MFRKSIQISEQSYSGIDKYHYKDNIRQLEKVIKVHESVFLKRKKIL